MDVNCPVCGDSQTGLTDEEYELWLTQHGPTRCDS